MSGFEQNAAAGQGVWDAQAYREEYGTTVTRPKDIYADDESVVYLGINSQSREAEKQVFAGEPGATTVTGSGTNAAMQGKIMAADGKTALDLAKEVDLQRFLKESGTGAIRTDTDGNPLETPEQAKARLDQLEALFLGTKGATGARTGGLDPRMRDEMAQFVQVLQKVEQGDLGMDRLVMSGHHRSSEKRLYSEGTREGVSFQQLQTLMEQFPEARAGVDDLMLSACNTLNSSAAEKQYKDIFPDLDTVWGYRYTQSPGVAQGSQDHIKAFLEASQGSDPERVRQAAQGMGKTTPGWNAYATIYED
jgi:hypothetical protein